VLPPGYYDRDPLEVAPALLGKLLVHGELIGRIVEVEAYRAELDPASHAFRGLTRRNATMFGPPGRLYVYFTYGMHFCANIVCQPPGTAGAVLLRALSPVAGVEQMRLARRRRSQNAAAAPATSSRGDRPLRDEQLLAGPARLCQAFGIDRSLDGVDLTDPASPLVVADDGTSPPARPGVGPRIGLGARVGDAAQFPWRFWVVGDRNVSHVSRGEGAHGALSGR
jgi:DNA-3-methyladenine glycosylase